MVAYALRRKAMHVSYIMVKQLRLVERFRGMQLQVAMGKKCH